MHINSNKILGEDEIVKFLGSYKTVCGNCTKDVKMLIIMAKQKAVEVTNIWNDTNVNITLKMENKIVDWKVSYVELRVGL